MCRKYCIDNLIIYDNFVIMFYCKCEIGLIKVHDSSLLFMFICLKFKLSNLNFVNRTVLKLSLVKVFELLITSLLFV